MCELAPQLGFNAHCVPGILATRKKVATAEGPHVNELFMRPKPSTCCVAASDVPRPHLLNVKKNKLKMEKDRIIWELLR